MPFLQRAPTPLYYDIRGDSSKSPLLILGGLGDTSRNWELYLEYFSKFFRTVFCDHRDAGQSPRITAPYLISDMADDVHGLLRELKLQDVAVLGFSMGGKIALELAQLDPERVSRMILVSTSVRLEPARHIRSIIPDHLDSDENQESFYENQFNILFSSAYRAKFPAKSFVKYKLNEPYPQSLQSFKNQFEALSRYSISDAELRRIDVPTLVLSGDDDLLVPVENARHLASTLKSATHTLYLGAGHVLQADEPLRFRQDVQKFISE